jgi:acetate kinase
VKILVINSGSSSLKFQLFDGADLTVSALGIIEQIGAAKSHVRLSTLDTTGGKQTLAQTVPIPDHRQAIMAMARLLREGSVLPDICELTGIGHRVVHGGEYFHKPVQIDESVIAAIEKLIPLAPLHNPANLAGIRVAMEHAPEIPQVAVFDTAFHQTIPEYAYLYALPHKLYTKRHIRRYGFHGTSHGYVCGQAAQFLGKPTTALNLISLHLGNGASAAAVQGGKCVETSMGMTPLEGLIMGTRSGDIDPAILFYLAREAGMDIPELDNLLNKKSGLKGICDENDMRTITRRAEQGDKQAGLALTMFCYRLKKYIGAYMAVLGGTDCIIFTGGIGENSSVVRELSCRGLEHMGIVLDKEKNKRNEKGIREIQATGSPVKLLVVPTDEEHAIAIETARMITRN